MFQFRVHSFKYTDELEAIFPLQEETELFIEKMRDIYFFSAIVEEKLNFFSMLGPSRNSPCRFFSKPVFHFNQLWTTIKENRFQDTNEKLSSNAVLSITSNFNAHMEFNRVAWKYLSFIKKIILTLNFLNFENFNTSPAINYSVNNLIRLQYNSSSFHWNIEMVNFSIHLFPQLGYAFSAIALIFGEIVNCLLIKRDENKGQISFIRNKVFLISKNQICSQSLFQYVCLYDKLHNFAILRNLKLQEKSYFQQNNCFANRCCESTCFEVKSLLSSLMRVYSTIFSFGLSTVSINCYFYSSML